MSLDCLELVLLCGLPFAGKTTLAAVLAREVGAVHLSLDAINAERGLHGGLGIPVEEWARTHQEALRRAEAFLKDGHSVVVDDTNCYRFLRDDFHAVARRQRAVSRVVYVDRPLPLLLERLEQNERTPTRPPVSREILLEVASKFEPPGADERTIVYPEGVCAEAWVARQFPEGP